MENIIYLTKEDIIDAHRRGFLTYGGSIYTVDTSCVEMRTIEPQNIVYGIEVFPALHKKAAVYLHRIITSHCFGDGNKRAAFISTDIFLKYNGYKLKVEENELYHYCYNIADHNTRPSLEEVAHWIKQHMVPFDLEELSDLLEDD